MDTQGHYQKINAKVPLSDMQDYSTTLRSISQGRAKYRMQFNEYSPMPSEMQKKLIEDYKKTEKVES